MTVKYFFLKFEADRGVRKNKLIANILSKNQLNRADLYTSEYVSDMS